MNISLIPRFRILPAVMAAFISLASICVAGGSIGWDEVKAEITKDDPFLATLIAKHFDVAHSGGALRVGHDKDGNSLVPGYGVGHRLPPYEFNAKPKDETGDFTLSLKFEPISFDDGKTITWQVTIRKKRESD